MKATAVEFTYSVPHACHASVNIPSVSICGVRDGRLRSTEGMFAEAEAAQAVTRDLQFIPATEVPRLLSEAIPFSICSLFG
jgi:hypothetical protein